MTPQWSHDRISGMRTELDIDEQVLTAAEAQARASGRSLDEIVEDALRANLAAVRSARKSYPFPTFAGGRLQPGVNLCHSTDLWDRMDRDSA
jgi:hypothetical protein